MVSFLLASFKYELKMDFVLDERAPVDWMFSCCMKLNGIVPHFSMDCFF